MRWCPGVTVRALGRPPIGHAAGTTFEPERDGTDTRLGGSQVTVRLGIERHLPKRSLYAAVAEHEAAPTVTVMVEPAVVFQRRIVTDPALLVSSLQLCPPSEAVASMSGWFEVT